MLAGDSGAIRQHGVTDGGRSWFANLLTAGAIGVATYDTIQAVKLAQKEKDLADKYYNISKDWLNYYNNTFKEPEDEELNEAKNIEYVEPEYDVARGRARAVAWAAFKGQLDKATRCLSRYCTGLRQQMLLDFAASQADALALAEGMGYRNERAYIESRNDVLFERKLNVAKRGRNLLPDTTELSKAAAGIYGNLWDQSWDAIGDASYFLGYDLAKSKARFPQMYLTGYGDYNLPTQRQAQSVAEGESIMRDVF